MSRLRVLFVPDSIYWVTGTLARSFASNNDWIEATIISGPVLPAALAVQPDLLDRIDLVHFTCTYASRDWLGEFRERVPCVTSHHHVSDWELQKHNTVGDAVIVSSDEWATDARARGVPAERIVTIPYGVDTEFFTPSSRDQRAAARQRLSLQEDDIAVGFFAKYSSNEHDRKGTDIFVESALRLHSRLSKLVLVIVGPGWTDLVERLRNAGVRCVWIPFAADATEVRETYWALDFYWVTARVEGGPVPLLEAMSCSVCCVSTPVGLAREVVQDGVNALSVPIDAPDAVVAATMLVANDADRRRAIGMAARTTMTDEMDSRVVTRRVRDAYEVAFEGFAARQRSGPARSISLPFASGDDRVTDTPRNALHPAARKSISLRERLAWAQALHIGGQPAEAWRILAHTWLKNPQSTLPLRYAARLLLPKPLLDGLVRIKRHVRRASHSSADVN